MNHEPAIAVLVMFLHFFQSVMFRHVFVRLITGGSRVAGDCRWVLSKNKEYKENHESDVNYDEVRQLYREARN
jgi:hypothetical protein